MKKNIIFGFLSFSLLLTGCLNGQNKPSDILLSAEEFSKKINETAGLTIIDVRTPDEFSQGHIQNALNINWNSDEFDNEIALLDKSKAVFVYCLSGGRSSNAAEKMRELGFKQVFELNGGMMKWRGMNYPETTDAKSAMDELSLLDFKKMIDSDKLVLIDFYADWCQPCKKMKPYLEALSNEMTNDLEIVRIDVDKNKQICKDLKIDALPVLQLYKNKSMVWQNTGFIEKEQVVTEIKNH